MGVQDWIVIIFGKIVELFNFLANRGELLRNA
jgi:hypothetical protein